jgi:hypothetical protein
MRSSFASQEVSSSAGSSSKTREVPLTAASDPPSGGTGAKHEGPPALEVVSITRGGARELVVLERDGKPREDVRRLGGRREETMTTHDNPQANPGPVRDIPVDWEALEDAFENNAPEVHSYLHLVTGDVLRVVDGVADPQMHARIAADPNYLRIDPVSSREQYRWMERYIPMVEDPELVAKLTQAIDGKGAFRRFKDVLMAYGPERERWFSFRSERLRIFMEAWLSAHALNPIARPAWTPDAMPKGDSTETPAVAAEPGRGDTKRGRNAESLRKTLREIADALGPRDLDTVVAFAEFVRARRAARSFSSHFGSDASHAQEEEAPASQETFGEAHGDTAS